MHATRSCESTLVSSPLCGGTHFPSRWGHGNERACTVSSVKNLHSSGGGGAKHDEEYKKITTICNNSDQKGAILNLAHASRGHGAGRLLAPSCPDHGRGLETTSRQIRSCGPQWTSHRKYFTASAALRDQRSPSLVHRPPTLLRSVECLAGAPPSLRWFTSRPPLFSRLFFSGHFVCPP